MATDQPGDGEAGERLEWTVWPAAQRPVLSVVVVVFCLGLAALSILVFNSTWFGFITLVVLHMALAPHFYATTYRLDGEGVWSRGGGGTAQRAWEAFRVALDLGDRVVLSPLTDAARWSARRRSIALRLAGNHDEVLAFVARHVPVK